MDREKFIELVGGFVKEFQENNIINDYKKMEILSNSTAWNKEMILIDLVSKIESHRLYEEKGFPYMAYVDKFLTQKPKPIVSSSKIIEEQDFS